MQITGYRVPGPGRYAAIAPLRARSTWPGIWSPGRGPITWAPGS